MKWLFTLLFKSSLKEFWELEAVRKLFDDKFTKSVGHEIDGLIFQPVEEVKSHLICFDYYMLVF